MTAPDPPLPRQDQARALGDPTRREIYRYLLGAGERDTDVAELTAHLGLNHTGIRQHLSKLVAAGLVTTSLEARRRPGRPRRLYRAVLGVHEARNGYEDLAAWLTEAVAGQEAPVEIGRRIGAGRATSAGSSTGTAVEQLAGVMEGLGFAPSVHHRAGGADVVLERCPYVSAVLVDPATVCSLHRSIAEGAAAAIGGLVVDDLVAFDPRRAGCRLAVSCTDA